MLYAIAFRPQLHLQAAVDFRQRVYDLYGPRRTTPEGHLVYGDDLETWHDVYGVIYWQARNEAGELWLMANQPREAGIVESF